MTLDEENCEHRERLSLGLHGTEAAARLYDAECALHNAHASRIDAWIVAAGDHLHVAVLALVKAVAYEHRLCESFECARLIESHCQNHCPQVYPCNTLCLLEGQDID